MWHFRSRYHSNQHNVNIIIITLQKDIRNSFDTPCTSNFPNKCWTHVARTTTCSENVCIFHLGLGQSSLLLKDGRHHLCILALLQCLVVVAFRVIIFVLSQATRHNTFGDRSWRQRSISKQCKLCKRAGSSIVQTIMYRPFSWDSNQEGSRVRFFK